MEKVFLEDDLPVAIEINRNKKKIKCTKFVISDLTALEYVEAQSKISGLQYVSISDVVAMVKLIDSNGIQYEPTYDEIAQTTQFNLTHFFNKKAELEAKVKAAN
ncbi:hypothetical protein KWE42_04625 [Acinetobacter pittii]|uniref:Uncharacterized protein n=1 Tax=Acinetobacter pittii TaxID=48296 RepID=A0AAE9MC38_ACIPI|nr:MULTISPECIES: hypothetical protein [Acinetobacter calcoaceticus/baumannii complex]AZP28906.1 hypothetical protein DLK06_07410 [Acinetobacter pittii]MCE5999311.1 hypothetical protein [Acinetobacter pittii]MCE6415198.1 hypothetical protein [Acinetobacter baumannii]MCE6798480.1 hypothetical protein [Acinetobacter baumannii]MCW1508526.1 hypothetical protein [Acinetobacter baumannii]